MRFFGLLLVFVLLCGGLVVAQRVTTPMVNYSFSVVSASSPSVVVSGSSSSTRRSGGGGGFHSGKYVNDSVEVVENGSFEEKGFEEVEDEVSVENKSVEVVEVEKVEGGEDVVLESNVGKLVSIIVFLVIVVALFVFSLHDDVKKYVFTKDDEED